MIHAARQFNSAQDIITNAAAVRNRLMRPANAFVAPKAVPVLKVVRRAVAKPMWQSERLDFDSHVLKWREHLYRLRLNPYKTYVRNRCTELGVDYFEIVGPSRSRHLTGPRQLIMWELKDKFGASYPRIGREFGNREHTTVLHAIRRVSDLKGMPTPEYVTGEKRMLTDPELKAQMKEAYFAGETIESMSDRFDICVKAINSVASTENWKRPSRKVDGFKNLPAEVNIALMKEDWESGRFTCLAMEDRHAVSDRTIRRIAAAHGWVKGSRKIRGEQE